MQRLVALGAANSKDGLRVRGRTEAAAKPNKAAIYGPFSASSHTLTCRQPDKSVAFKVRCTERQNRHFKLRFNRHSGLTVTLLIRIAILPGVSGRVAPS
jgi:hypothetical protein